MDRRSTILLFAALVAPAFAGCVGTAQATANESLQPADAAAKGWDADAQLARIVGVEGQWVVGAPGGGQDWSKAADDDSIGDGRAELWMFRYVAPDKTQAYVVMVDKSGKVVDQAEERRTSEDAPIGAWSLDSDEALSIALKANEGLQQGVEKESFGIVSVLRDDGDGAQWIIIGGGLSSGAVGGGIVILDAQSGDVITSQGGFQGF